MARNSDLPPWQEDTRTSDEINRDVYLERAQEWTDLANAANGANGGGEALAPVAELAAIAGARAQDAKTNQLVAADEAIPLTRVLPQSGDFPVDKLPPPIARAIHALYAHTQAPLGICGNSFLAVITLGAQGHADIKLPIGQTRPLSDYFFTIALSGDRKTSVDNFALVPAKDRQAALHLKYEAEIKEYINKRDAYAAERSKILKNKKTNYGQKTDALATLEEPQEPASGMITCGEPTIEGLANVMTRNQPTVGIFNSEGGAFIGGHAMTDEAKLRTIATLSQIWDDGCYDRTRAKEGNTHLRGRRLTIHLQIQPKVAASVFSDEIMVDQGILSRVLPSAPESLQGSRIYQAPSAQHKKDLAAATRKLSRLFQTELNIKQGTINELEPRVLEFDVESRPRWFDYLNEVELRLGATQPFSEIRPFASKMAEHAARLAGSMELYLNPAANSVGVAVLKSAIALVEFYAHTHLRLAASSRINVRLAEAETVAAWLLTDWEPDWGEYVSLTDLLQYGPSVVRDADKAREIMGILERHRYVEKTNKVQEIRGKRRRRSWKIRFRVFESTPATPATVATLGGA